MIKAIGKTLFFFLLCSLVLFGKQPNAFADEHIVCLPTCSETDARFFSLAGSGLQTLGETTMAVEIVVPGTQHQVGFGVFDGDTGGHWDLVDRRSTSDLEFVLIADPNGDGTGTVEVGRWLGSEMTDNGWYDISVATGPEALAQSGSYFYTLRVSKSAPTDRTESNFKIRSDNSILFLRPVTFSFVGALRNVALDAPIVFPGYPSDLTTSTYDGVWDIYISIPHSTTFLELWDGDFDYGSADCTDNDTDDPDTPNEQQQLWMSGAGLRFEGVASGSQTCLDGTGFATGAPADDNRWTAYRRSPNVRYEVIGPDGAIYTNGNPSGNQEWEQFRIETDPNVPADYYVDGLLPGGVYQVHLEGADLANLNAWRLDYNVLCVDAAGNPCNEPPKPYLIGDYVWHDANGNGLQDEPADAGIAGVLVNLLSGEGLVIASTTTDENGYYQFDVNPGTYAVEVDASNFNKDGVLEGRTTTTGNRLANTVVDQNILTYDFGYRSAKVSEVAGTGTPGYWKNHPEAWPVLTITLGGVNYTVDEAIANMISGGGDKSYELFQQLVAASLNVASGTDGSCIGDTIAAADAWLTAYPLGSKVKARHTSWQESGELLKNTLDSYNNGQLCAPARD